MDPILTALLEYGLPGIFIGYLVWVNWKKEERINDLTDKLIEKTSQDVEKFTQITVTMERILSAVQAGGR